MRIAAVMTAYNSAATIESALQSIMGQIRPPEEIIVVDDGSTDATCSIVERFRGVTLIRRPNGGPAAARNTALRAATSEWLAFLDSDDRWLPEKLARAELAMGSHPEAVALFSSVLMVHGDTVREHAGAPEWVLGVDELLRGCAIPTPSCALVRRDVALAAGGFNEAVRYCDDWEFWIRVAELGPIRRIAGPLAVYSLGDGGIHSHYVEARTQVTPYLLAAAWRHLRFSDLDTLISIREALREHFGAFAYYASLERRVFLTLATGLLTAIIDPWYGSYRAGRCLLRAAIGL